MPHYKLSPQAEDDLDRIFEYGIDTFGVQQAIMYMENLKSRFSEIGENPLLYPTVDHIRKGYRRCVCGVHSIFYRINNDTPEIMRLINREDTRKFLAS